jgi:hypothetical protein
MANLVLKKRTGNPKPLTWQEMDNNWSKIEQKVNEQGGNTITISTTPRLQFAYPDNSNDALDECKMLVRFDPSEDVSSKKFYLYRQRKERHNDLVTGERGKIRSNSFAIIKGKNNPLGYEKIPIPFKLKPFETIAQGNWAGWYEIVVSADEDIYFIEHGGYNLNAHPFTISQPGEGLFAFIIRHLALNYNVSEAPYYRLFGCKILSCYPDSKGNSNKKLLAVCDNANFQNPSYFKIRLVCGSNEISYCSPCKTFAKTDVAHISCSVEIL